MVARLILAKDAADWKEGDHPRGKGGQFGSGGGGHEAVAGAAASHAEAGAKHRASKTPEGSSAARSHEKAAKHYATASEHYGAGRESEGVRSHMEAEGHRKDALSKERRIAKGGAVPPAEEKPAEEKPGEAFIGPAKEEGSTKKSPEQYSAEVDKLRDDVTSGKKRSGFVAEDPAAHERQIQSSKDEWAKNHREWLKTPEGAKYLAGRIADPKKLLETKGGREYADLFFPKEEKKPGEAFIGPAPEEKKKPGDTFIPPPPGSFRASNPNPRTLSRKPGGLPKLTAEQKASIEQSKETGAPKTEEKKEAGASEKPGGKEWSEFDRHHDSKDYYSPSGAAAAYPDTANEFAKAYNSSTDPHEQLKALSRTKKTLMNDMAHKPGPITGLHAGMSRYIKAEHGMGAGYGPSKPVSNGERISRYLSQKWIGPRGSRR